VPEFSSGLALGLLIIPVLASLIIIHELGHFFAARSVGVKVEEFGIGIPPRARGWRRNGVLWSLNWIPFGGFVRVKGEDGADMSDDSMNSKGPGQRAFFLAAGSAMNFLAAIVLSIVIVAFQGVPDTSSNVYIANVEESSPAEGADWLPGDAIHAVDGEVIADSEQLQSAIGSHVGQEVSVTIRRGDELIETSLIPRLDPPPRQGATGISMVQGTRSVLKITEVAPGTAAADAGWQNGDEIIAVNGIELEAEAQARSLFLEGAGDAVAVTLERDGQTLETSVAMPQPAVTLTQVLTDSPASDALLYPGDEIVRIDGEAVTDGDSFGNLLAAAGGTSATLEIVREGRALDLLLVVPELGEDDSAIDLIGVNGRVENPYEALGTDGIVARTFNPVSFGQIIPEGWGQFWFMTSGTFEGLSTMVTEGVDPDQIMGPVGMGQLTSESLSSSATPAWYTLLFIATVISVGLGVLNLLPLPALDGGRLLFVLIEVLRGGRRISPEKEGLVHLAGMVVLLGLMFVIAFGDVSRLVDGRSIFP